VDASLLFLLLEVELEQLLCYVRYDGREELEDGQQDLVEGVLGRLASFLAPTVRVVEPVLGYLEVEVTEYLPEELLCLMLGPSEVIGFEGFCALLDETVHLGEDPSVQGMVLDLPLLEISEVHQ